MTDPAKTPKLFVSYSWTSPGHVEWVIQLATELRESGVDVVLDKWDLKEGHDAHAFMERMVTDPQIEKVVMVCDAAYTKKTNERSGGAGTEAQIISGEIYAKADQTKFVAVLAEKDNSGNPILPAYYTSRIYIDLSGESEYTTGFEQLLRWVYDKPLHQKPEIGKRPEFLDEDNRKTLGSGSRHRRAIDSIRNDRAYSSGALREYLESFVVGMENFRIADDGQGEFDDEIVANIYQFLPYRNELIELLVTLAQFRNTTDTHLALHGFFEELMPYMDRIEGMRAYREWDFDNFKFIINELFIYCIAIFLKYECFDAVSYLLSNRYLVRGRSDDESLRMESFGVFRTFLKSLEHRNKRLDLRRHSLHADLLKERCNHISLRFSQFMQADFVLFLSDAADAQRDGRRQLWYPYSLLYRVERGAVFELFARAESQCYFDRVKAILGVGRKEELQPLMEAFKGESLYVPKWDFHRVYPSALMGYDNLATRP